MIGLDALAGLGVWCLLLPGLYALGRVFVKEDEVEDPFMVGTVGVALGLIFWVHGTALLGLARQFRWLPLAALMVVLAGFCALRQARHFWSWLSSGARLFVGGRGVYGVLGFLFGGVLLGTLALCFLPEIANDALCYQLNVAKNFALNHSLIPDDYDFNSYTSIFMNSLYAAGLVFQSVSMAKLSHALTGILLVAVFMRRIQIETQNLLAARLAGLILFLTPTLMFEMTSTYVDVAVSFFVFLSFDRFLAAKRSGKSRDWLLGGLFLGTAVSTKVLILLAVIPFSLLFLTRLFKSARKSQVIGEGFLFLSGLLAGCGYLFVQSALLTANPVFPYFGKWFGSTEYGMLGQFLAMGPAKSILGFLTLPWNMTFRPQDYDGGYPLGPAFLMILPFAFYGALKNSAYRPHLIFVSVFLPVWYLLFHNVRFLFPVLVLLAWAGTAGFVLLLKGRPRLVQQLWIFPFAVLILPLLAISGYHYRAQWPVLAGYQSRDAFLRQMERSYPLSVWMEDHLPQNAVILNAEENRQFYFPRKSVREIWYFLRTRYDKVGTAESVSQRLKTDGFTHLVMYRVTPEMLAGEEPRYQLLRALTQNPALAMSLAVIQSENTREAVFSYEVFRLL